MTVDPSSSAPSGESPGEQKASAVIVEQDVIDSSNAWDVKPALMQALYDSGPHLTVDLSGVSFIDSTGLGMLVTVLREARDMGGSVVLVNVRPEVERVLSVTGLDHLFGLRPPPE